MERNEAGKVGWEIRRRKVALIKMVSGKVFLS